MGTAIFINCSNATIKLIEAKRKNGIISVSLLAGAKLVPATATHNKKRNLDGSIKSFKWTWRHKKLRRMGSKMAMINRMAVTIIK
jgi:hypothetical protein